MIHRGVIVPNAKKFLDNKDYRSAILELSASLEEVLFVKFLFEYKRKPESMDKWTLGKYVIEVIKLRGTKPEWNYSLKKFVELRNMTVHSRHTLIWLLKSEEKNIEELLRRVCTIVEQITANYGREMDLENAFAKHIIKEKSKIESLFKV